MERINRLHNFYLETGTPIVFEDGYNYDGNKIKFRYSNTTRKQITGFDVTIEVVDNDTGKINYDNFFVDLEDRPLNVYFSRTIAFELALMDPTKSKIGRVYPRVVHFDDNSFWMLK